MKFFVKPDALLDNDVPAYIFAALKNGERPVDVLNELTRTWVNTPRLVNALGAVLMEKVDDNAQNMEFFGEEKTCSEIFTTAFEEVLQVYLAEKNVDRLAIDLYLVEKWETWKSALEILATNTIFKQRIKDFLRSNSHLLTTGSLFSAVMQDVFKHTISDAKRTSDDFGCELEAITDPKEILGMNSRITLFLLIVFLHKKHLNAATSAALLIKIASDAELQKLYKIMFRNKFKCPIEEIALPPFFLADALSLAPIDSLQTTAVLWAHWPSLLDAPIKLDNMISITSSFDLIMNMPWCIRILIGAIANSQLIAGENILLELVQKYPPSSMFKEDIHRVGFLISQITDKGILLAVFLWLILRIYKGHHQYNRQKHQNRGKILTENILIEQLAVDHRELALSIVFSYHRCDDIPRTSLCSCCNCK